MTVDLSKALEGDILLPKPHGGRIKNHHCCVCGIPKTAENTHARWVNGVQGLQSRCKVCARLTMAEYRQNTPLKHILYSARARAKERGFPCTIEEYDLEMPSECPVLGMPLKLSGGKVTDTSPTLDKVVPELGYVPGNVCIISHRANRLKSNATPEELRAVLAYMTGMGGGRA